MSWAITAGFITLCGFLITVGTLGFKLSAVLTRLDVTVKSMGESLRVEQKERDREHEEIFGSLTDHEKRLQAHDLRLHDLEHDSGKGDAR